MFFPIFNKSLKHDKPKATRRKLVKINTTKQTTLDFGQPLPKLTKCSTCMMDYRENDSDDEHLHAVFHDKCKELAVPIKYQYYKKENIVKNIRHGSLVLKISASDIKSDKILTKLMADINEELGFPSDRVEYSNSAKLYIYIDDCKRILGACITEKCTQAHKLENGDKTSSESFACKVGINRIWVNRHNLRRGIATTLLDTIRSTYIFGHYLTTEEIAFSSPTSNGRDFATHYTGVSDFLVYCQSSVSHAPSTTVNNNNNR